MRVIQKKNLFEHFDVKGKWFLPNQEMESQGIDGILRYTPQRIVLELIGIFEDDSPLSNSYFSSSFAESQSTIHGFSDQGEWFSLFDCHPVNARTSYPGFKTITYGVNRFYVGTELITAETAIPANDAQFAFANLNAWINYNVIECKSLLANTYQELCLTVKPPLEEKQLFNVPVAGITVSEELRYFKENPKNLLLDERVSIVIDRFYNFTPCNKDSFNIHEAFEKMNVFRRLIALLLGNATYFTYVDYSFNDNNSLSASGNPSINTCRMFFRQVGDISKVKPITLPVSDSSFLIRRNDIKYEFGKILEKWFQDQEHWGEITNAYISDYYLPTYIDHELQNIIRALETYHRFYLSSSKTEDLTLSEERNLILSMIDSQISREYQEYFKERICYESEPSLRNRLKDILNIIPSELANRLFGELTSKKRNLLISSIVETRNYYTHKDSKIKYPNMVEDSRDQGRLATKLSFVLQYLVLRQLGVDEQILLQRIINHSNLFFL